jgi:hypothetical protein
MRPVFSRRTTGSGQMAAFAIHFTNENASFAPAASPVSVARRIGQVMIANPRKNSANLWQGT